VRIVFVGPSLPDASDFAGRDVEIRPPARQGDVMRAIQGGATAVGLIDGLFEFVAPVWHKELLFALSQGLPVLGAASMGALRAAECAAFGMIGVGRIFDDYMSGRRVDDADVALLHGPVELGYPAVTVPMVNVDATMTQAGALELLCDERCDTVRSKARTIFFKERSWKRIAEVADIGWIVLGPIVEQARTDQKRRDALELLTIIADVPLAGPPPGGWNLNTTPVWRTMYP